MAEHKRKQRGRHTATRRDRRDESEARPDEQGEGEIRLNKYVARAGVC